jgi:hypothetical protein
MRETLDLIVALVLFGLFIHRLRHLVKSRPLWTVANSRRLLFAGFLLTSALYLLVRVIKQHQG